MKISIVTPSYNQGQFLEQTIDSILSQSYSNIEYIIIDGGSDDNSVEVIKKYQKHLSYWVSEKDKGQSDAIKKGLARSSGEIFNWINSDDYLEPNALKEIGNKFMTSQHDIFLSKINVVGSNEHRILEATPFYNKNIGKTIGVARVNQPGMWWKTSIVKSIGGINPELRYIMDLDLWVRYLLTHKPKIHNENIITANFRLHTESKTVSELDTFNSERNAYYYWLFTQYELIPKLANFTRFVNIKPNSKFNFPESSDKSVLEGAKSNFLLLLADEMYCLGLYKEAKGIISEINQSTLDSEDQKLVKKISFRTNFPYKLAKFGRKLKF